MSLKFIKPDAENSWKYGKYYEGEVAVTESGAYVYHDNEFIPYPVFCATCMHCDIENNICTKLFDSWGARLKIDPTTFYCAKHSTIVDKFD